MLYVYEALLGVDKIEFDDSKFKIGISKREKHFINLKSLLRLTDKREYWVSQETQNHPALAIYMGI
jgi:hypothetical protein